jgi:allantoinase
VFMFHAEVGGPIDEANKSLSEHACSSSKYETFLRSRPKEAENEAIALIIRLCREYLVRYAHFCQPRTHAQHALVCQC